MLAGEPAADPGGAVGYAGLRRIGFRRDVAEEGRRVRPHRRQLASHVAADPEAKIGYESPRRVLVAKRPLAAFGERFRRFRRAAAARREECDATGDVQFRQSLPPRRFCLDLVDRRQRAEQRLCLGDLLHLRRRRKAIERRREDSVGVERTAGRPIELRHGQRRAQFKAARALPLRDGDGVQEGFFRGRRVSGVLLEQDIAAGAMQFRFERAVARAARCRQRVVKDRNGAARIARPGFSLSQRDP
jgi:hypothetical protein